MQATVPMHSATVDHQTHRHSAVNIVNQVIDLLESQFDNGRNETQIVTPHPSHKQGSTHPRRAALCARKQGFVRFLTFFFTRTKPCHCDLQSLPCNPTRTTSTKAAVTNIQAAVPMQISSLDHQTHWHNMAQLSTHEFNFTV